MKILILTLGSRGDVQPYVALGTALKSRGHDVTVSTGRGFEDMIEAAGLSAAPLSDDVRELIDRPEIQQAMRSFSGKVRAWRESKGLFRRQLDDMWGVARDLRPDAIVYHHPKALAAPHIAEALQAVAIPAALIPAYIPTAAFPSPGLPFRTLGPTGNRMSHRIVRELISWLLSGKIDTWRQQTLGLGRMASRDLFEGYHPNGLPVPRLHPFSRHLVPVADAWSDRDHITGYWFTDRTDDWEPPDGLARFLDAGPPPVYVGFGSMPTEDAKRLTGIVAEALHRAGERGVLATGWGGLDDSMKTGRIHVLDAAPHDWLFPRCAAVVHHGGTGTTHEGLRWGRPSIVCPVFGDQPFWGQRVQATGAGPAPLPQKRLKPEKLAEALVAVREPAMTSRAAEIGKAMQEEPGADGAASVLDSFFATL